MSYVKRLAVLVVTAFAAVVVPLAPADAAVHTTLPCEVDSGELAPGDVVELAHDVTCDELLWDVPGVAIDLNGHTLTVHQPKDLCSWDDIWFCDVELGVDGVLEDGRVVGAGVSGGRVHDVTFVGATAAWTDGWRNEFRDTLVVDSVQHQRSLFIDSHLQHTGRLRHNALLRSQVRLENPLGFHGQVVEVVGNWLVESPLFVSVELNAPGDVRGVIDRNLLVRSSIDVSGVLGPTLGSMAITGNVVLGAPTTGIRVHTDPPEFGPGGPLSVARNQVWFSRGSISVNEPFLFGDLSGNRSIFSGPCQGVTCAFW